MGDMADDAYNDALIQSLEYDSEYETEFKWWPLGNGSDKRVTDMDESHLRNCIAKIKREGWRTEWLPTLEGLLAKRESRWKTLAKTKMPFKRRI